ncbi:hypothetical protein NIES2101_07500 [Calothrix sp. HK-06]|nr:hypothetical protein NIES2101_07500 [Calothrix sp. HK-06]
MLASQKIKTKKMLEQLLINPSLDIGIEIFVALVVIMLLEAALFALIAFILHSILVDSRKYTSRAD